MKISVIITCYTEGEKILTSVKSVENQKFKDYELILVNDKSKDEATNKVCLELQSKGYNVIWRDDNGGLSAARNTAILAAQHEIIVPLDGDDELPEKSLFLIQETFRTKPEADFIFGDYIKFTGKQLNFVSTAALCSKNGLINARELANNWILLGTSPFKKSLWLRINGYDEDKSITNSVQDIDFFMRAVDQDLKGVYTPQIIYQWNDSEGSMNKNVQSNSFKNLMLKNRSFLLKYRFKNEAEFKNYIVTMMFGNKFYADVVNYIKSDGLSNLRVKNLVKYYLALTLKK